MFSYITGDNQDEEESKRSDSVDIEEVEASEQAEQTEEAEEVVEAEEVTIEFESVDPDKGKMSKLDEEDQGNGEEEKEGFLARFRHREYTNEERRGIRLCIAFFILIVFITGVGLLWSSLKKVEETKYGLQYNRHRKQLDDAAKSGGLFLGPPGYKFIKFPSTFITAEMDDRTCVSRDGLRVQFSVTFQYKMTAENMYPAITKYRDFMNWAEIVEAAGLSAIHHSCSEFNISNFQNKRGQIQSTMESNVRLKLEGDPETGSEGVNAVAVSLQLRNVELPEEYSAAVAEKQSAEEDIALAQNQRLQETTKADTELLQAREEARKIVATATNEAEVLLTEARLKAQETTFAFEKEAQAIVEARDALGLETEGVLTYLATTMIGEARNLKVSAEEPAKLSRKDELVEVVVPVN